VLSANFFVSPDILMAKVAATYPNRCSVLSSTEKLCEEGSFRMVSDKGPIKEEQRAVFPQ
jgi:hypothetical protein